jgi:hypothetical protein
MYVIYNGSAIAGLLSTSATSPTMPSGYTYKGYVGAIYYSAGFPNVFSNHQQFGRWVLTQGYSAVNNGTATTATSVSLLVPTTAKIWLGQANITLDSSGNGYCLVSAESTANYGVYPGMSGGGASGQINVDFTMPIFTAQTAYYYLINAASVNIKIVGWAY